MMDNTERAMTIGEFCHAENISKATYYKLKRKGLGPEETFVPVAGLSLVRLSPVARRRWHATLAELRETKAARPLGQERPGSQDEHLPYRCRPGHGYIGVDAGRGLPAGHAGKPLALSAVWWPENSGGHEAPSASTARG